jgi:hypothetical protein
LHHRSLKVLKRFRFAELHLEKLTDLEGGRGGLCARCLDFQELQHLTYWVHAIQKKEILSDLALPREYRTALARCLQNDLFTQVCFRFLAHGLHCSRAASLKNPASVGSLCLGLRNSLRHEFRTPICIQFDNMVLLSKSQNLIIAAVNG